MLQVRPPLHRPGRRRPTSSRSRTSKAAHGRALDDIATRGRRALLVGGTGLYHRVVIDDFDLPGEWPDVRAELEAEADTAVLFDRLAARSIRLPPRRWSRATGVGSSARSR